MNNERYVAYALIAIGGIALLSRISQGAGWLWVGLVAIAFLAAYLSQRSYGFLVVGSILAGIAVGILLEGSWGWDGAFLISLGIGFMVIDQVERRESRWPLYLGGILAALGLFTGLVESGVLGSIWFAILLIVVGGYLLTRGGRPTQETPAPPAAPPPAAPPPAPSATPESASEPEAAAEAETAPEPAAPEPAAPEQPTASTTAEVTDPTVARRLEALQAWRRATAEREGRAPYLILNNETLRLIAEANPRTLDELSAIRGIGPVKRERYGKEILELLRTL